MRSVNRILIGVGAASLLAVAAPTAAQAAVPAAAETTAQTAVRPVYSAEWGPFFSFGRRAEARGRVEVEERKRRDWYWDREVVWEKKCHRRKGVRHCKPVKKVVKVKKWRWERTNRFTVTGVLENRSQWRDRKHGCAWATFKVTRFDGDVSYETFRNCGKRPDRYRFGGRDAKLIQVKVTKGGRHHPHHQGTWQTVYAAR
ncbi:hypothetical protein [Thermostaphylospora chromogena]|uniref:Secreted protein n=1 Tax=Thermostaphylospora chromogena TaxID=35622 RepID=A0A1H1GLH8_9ACTN|nr:hypothetical protein [Thermostaphylospora chromogena]SDR14040.1 hypothetical protein SAMN04489764_3671 [Thermostaphylospora chromogena]